MGSLGETIEVCAAERTEWNQREWDSGGGVTVPTNLQRVSASFPVHTEFQCPARQSSEEEALSPSGAGPSHERVIILDPKSPRAGPAEGRLRNVSEIRGMVLPHRGLPRPPRIGAGISFFLFFFLMTTSFLLGPWTAPARCHRPGSPFVITISHPAPEALPWKLLEGARPQRAGMILWPGLACPF